MQFLVIYTYLSVSHPLYVASSSTTFISAERVSLDPNHTLIVLTFLATFWHWALHSLICDDYAERLYVYTIRLFSLGQYNPTYDAYTHWKLSPYTFPDKRMRAYSLSPHYMSLAEEYLKIYKQSRRISYYYVIYWHGYCKRLKSIDRRSHESAATTSSYALATEYTYEALCDLLVISVKWCKQLFQSLRTKQWLTVIRAAWISMCYFLQYLTYLRSPYGPRYLTAADSD